MKAAFGSGKHVVCVNKAPLAVALPALRELARHNRVSLRFSGAVGGGTPVLALAHTPSFVGVEKGFFLKYVLDLKLKILGSGQEVAKAMQAGEIQFGAAAYSNHPIALERGFKAKMVVGVIGDATALFYDENLAVVARPGSGIRAPEDLAGDRMVRVAELLTIFRNLGDALLMPPAPCPWPCAQTPVSSVLLCPRTSCSTTANIHCPSGHYVCNECHASDSIKIITQFCLSSGSKNPMEMAKVIMKHPTMPMHGPEHHAMIAAVLVTAYKNFTGKVTDEEIKEAIRRGSTVPGGYCGLYGTDAAAIATGIAMSIILMWIM